MLSRRELLHFCGGGSATAGGVAGMGPRESMEGRKGLRPPSPLMRREKLVRVGEPCRNSLLTRGEGLTDDGLEPDGDGPPRTMRKRRAEFTR